MDAFVAGCMGFDKTSTTYLWQLSNVQISPQLQKALQNAHSADTVLAAVQTQSPVITFDTPAISTMLGKCGVDGLSEDEVYIWFTSMAHGGMRSAGSTHVKVTAKQNLVTLQSISASQGGVAMASYAVNATYDGTNAPLTYTIDQALPARAADVAEEAYTVGPVYLGSTAIETQSWNLDMGNDIFSGGMNGEAYPRMASIRGRRPVVTATTLDLEAVATATAIGASIDDVLLYLRKLTPRGAPVADATETNIQIAFAEALVSSDTMSGGMDGNASVNITIDPVFDGTNEIVIVDTTAAISAP